MDRLFDRLGNLLRSLMAADSAGATGYDARDPDMRAALEELDAYLRSGRADHRGFADEAHGPRQGQQAHPQAPPPEDLRRDFANLEVPFAASAEAVQRSYRGLLRRYHPDRFSRDPEKQLLATEITKRLNESFQNIRRYRQSHGPPD